MPVTFVSTTALIVTRPVPLPRFVSVPTWFTVPPDTVRLPLLWAAVTTLPVPVMPPEHVGVPVDVDGNVRPAAPTVSGPLTVQAAVLACVIVVTFVPSGALTTWIAVPVLALVSVPTLFTAPDDTVITSVLADKSVT